MTETYVRDQTFEKLDFTQKPLAKGEYEDCTFRNCNFENHNLSGFKFTTCEFTDCNLSLAPLNGTALRDIKFKDCKMLGLQFERCNDFGLAFSFQNCQLNLSSFFQLNLRKTLFKDCQLRESDFSESNLTSAVFAECDLSQAIFQNTNLEKADFRTAFYYVIDPENNRLKGARFSAAGVSGLLEKYQIKIEHEMR
ncbi:pentapeptide repeat-containing protein [Kaistella sp. 97-N-M2]|uniref:pentapeptide repeat-containing protein n=1 Tax=Kaistella sp. 97-N-M2 TaxID=2908645 RepID=UPI001F2FA311|nr:pentapeptide repeat-containing protein [Kaistella sp. 97-N-M2]UJF30238.1 pentapeptide repeat-containing protein [Kaistella sp. 97-N-M2]